MRIFVDGVFLALGRSFISLRRNSAQADVERERPFVWPSSIWTNGFT